MKYAMREAGFAILAWLIPFATAVSLSAAKTSHPELFDSLMGVVVAATAALLGCVYLRRVSAGYARVGVRIGFTWLFANWLLDGLMFSSGPMKMSAGQYMMDIGLAYLTIPAVTIALGVAASGAARRASVQSH